MYFRQLLNDDTACASYLLGCKTHSAFAVVDQHVDLVDEYLALAEAQGAEIVAVFETHLQAHHVSGLPVLVARTGATAYVPEGAGVDFDTTPWPTARSCGWATPTCRPSPPRGTRPRITPTW